MNTAQLLALLQSEPDNVAFADVMATIDADYRYTPTRFTNGAGEERVINEAGRNEGSCKIFAFAKLHGLNESQTLACFGDYYRNDVCNHPEGSDHANIRSFMRHGWAGIAFDGQALTPKQ